MIDPGSADALQHAWLMPFELVDLTPELDRFTPAIVSEDGTVYIPSGGLGPAEAEVTDTAPSIGPEYAYAIAALVSEHTRVLATNEWAEAAATEILERSGGNMTAWFLRAKYRGGGTETLILRGPEPVQPRVVLDGPVAVLLDLGMVLTRFDRNLFAKNFLTQFGQPVPNAAWEKMQKLRPALEAGDLLADEFLDQIQEPLGLVRPDRDALSRVWASILSLKRSTVALARRLAARENVAVVLVSNTDPIMLRYLRTDLGMDDLADHMAASCQDGVRPKGEDTSLWKRGREMATHRLGTEPEAVIGIDDIRSYLHRPLAEGTLSHAIHYRNFAQFKYELGVCGLYIPLERESLLEA